MNRYEQAVDGLDIEAAGGVVMVADGHCTWLADEDAFDLAADRLADLAVLDEDEGGGEAYGQLCSAIRGPVANTDGGGTRGTEAERAALVSAARAAGLDVPEHCS